MTKVALLRNLADHVINLMRYQAKLGNIQTLESEFREIVGKKRDEIKKEPEAKILLDEIIPEEPKSKEKTEFLNLTREKAVKLCEVINGFDNQPKQGEVSISNVWKPIKKILKHLSYFFSDLKEKTYESSQKFSTKLQAFINDFRSRIRLQREEFFQDPNCLGQGANLLEILSSDNFVEDHEKDKQTKKEHLVTAMSYLNDLQHQYAYASINPPKTLAKTLVEMSELESRLHACIGRLAA